MPTVGYTPSTWPRSSQTMPLGTQPGGDHLGLERVTGGDHRDHAQLAHEHSTLATAPGGRRPPGQMAAITRENTTTAKHTPAATVMTCQTSW